MSSNAEELAARLQLILREEGREKAIAEGRKLVGDYDPAVRARISFITFGDKNALNDLNIGNLAGRDIINIYTQETVFDTKSGISYYLQNLIEKYGFLHLHKLLSKEMSGREERTAPSVRLQDVFTKMVTDHWLPSEAFELRRDQILAQMDQTDPSRVLPGDIRIAAIFDDRESTDSSFRQRYALDTQRLSITRIWELVRQDVAQLSPGPLLRGWWYRLESPRESLRLSRRVVLLGAPGSGKSTILRSITIADAGYLIDGKPISPEHPLPFFCSLGRFAQDLTDDDGQDLTLLTEALVHSVAVTGPADEQLRQTVQAYLRNGEAIICFDGLDEVSGASRPVRSGKKLSPRDRVSKAIQTIAGLLHRTAIIVTCRTKPYEQSESWQLRDRWTLRVLAPLTLGQVRYFVETWYTQVGASGGTLMRGEALRRARRLYETLEQNKPLHGITQSPLLLTMLSLLDYNNKHLPAKRADVYDELVQLLLDRWESIRSDDRRQRLTIGERLGLQHLDMKLIRGEVHKLAYKAHCSAVDGRGVLNSSMLREHLNQFFARQINPENPRLVEDHERAKRSQMFIDLLQDETGLIHAEDDNTYVLPHLTFEEYLCACYLADDVDNASPDVVYRHWHESGDRWREVILLLMGRLVSQGKFWMAYNWLQMLLDNQFLDYRSDPLRRGLKGDDQLHRDALLAAVCYTDLGRQATMGGRAFNIDRFEDKLHDALVAAMQQRSLGILLAQRLDIAHELRILGDLRYPVSVEQWAEQTARAITQTAQRLSPAVPGAPSGGALPYWCYAPRATYVVGGWESSRPEKIKLDAFWIARFPITVKQFRAFVGEDHPGEIQQWQTDYGRRWMASNQQTAPWGARQSLVYGDSQPVMGISWYEAAAFARWLTAQLRGSFPKSYVIRLPTEAEWEVAATFSSGQRPLYPWGNEPPTPERAIYEAAPAGGPTPVGCCPAGASALGVMDLAGNVWELTASDAKAYPARSHLALPDLPNDAMVAWRGGRWNSSAPELTCGARQLNHTHIIHGLGFRLVIGPDRVS